MSTETPTLLSPIDLGPLTLPNRVVMGSMHTGLEDRAFHYPKLAAYFAERARGGVGLIITGGIAPNWRGWLLPLGGMMTNRAHVLAHRMVTKAVHDAGGKIAMQILHAGRYAYHPFSRTASRVKSPITPFTPKAMSDAEVRSTIEDFGRAAKLAREAGYDGVEIMGSEGYLLNQFLAERVNRRTDHWGGSAEARRRMPVGVVRAVREAVGEDFLVIYRHSLLDLVEQGATWEETVDTAKALEAAGVNVFNTGIGWHEARIPTIATSVPRAAFREATRALRDEVSIPVIASNRINTPEIAEGLLAKGDCDLVSMARPLLADPDWVRKAEQGKADEINVCIACNQACLDHTFSLKRATCMVNPRACRETELRIAPAKKRRRIAVVGAGVAGLSCATTAAKRGHDVTLFEAGDAVGGQFRLAAQVPGKEEFRETIRYYEGEVARTGVKLELGRRVGASELGAFDEVVVACGVAPRVPKIPGAEHPKVVTYAELLRGDKKAGERVAVIGAGGVGVDVCAYLLHEPDVTPEEFAEEWGIERGPAGALGEPEAPHGKREIWLLQRREKTKKMGSGPGKTTGWVHRISLAREGVHMMGSVKYVRIDDEGLHVDMEGRREVLPVDTVVLCAGQVSVPFDLERAHVIGGAALAAELDAKRAIREGTELGAKL